MLAKRAAAHYVARISPSRTKTWRESHSAAIFSASAKDTDTS
jgi:hypothetical protein